MYVIHEEGLFEMTRIYNSSPSFSQIFLNILPCYQYIFMCVRPYMYGRSECVNFGKGQWNSRYSDRPTRNSQ